MIKNVILSLCVVAAAHASTFVNAEAEVVEATATTKPSSGKTGNILNAISIATSVIPLIGGLFKSKKQCEQVACWISTPTCYQQVADQIQSQVFQGRDGYRIESNNNQGAWVRYWRVRTDVSSVGTIASGKCDNGASFTVNNCQRTGKVNC
ncbi:hypothetical protein FI667_g15901, partial [Globisporangium splendens]